ncbi:MAG: flagellar hook-basal body protein [Oligoflexales bacterium]
MLNNVYSALSGAIAQEKALDVIANNLANVNTAGFKGDNVTFTVLDAEPNASYTDPLPPANYKQDLTDVMPLKGNDMDYVGIAGIHRDDTQGPAITTHNKTDLMIEGDGYYTVQTDEGVRYSRAGDFTLSQDGVLVTKNGHPVMGENGAIYLRSGQFDVNNGGEIYQDGQLVDRLIVSKFEDPQLLEKVGKNYFFHTGPDENVSRMEAPAIRQGYLEGSNVNAIKNLTAMIIAHRAYEAYQKATANFDKMMEKSANTIGSVRA